MNNREAWLTKSAELISKRIFKPLGYEVPQVRISIGFTGSKSGKALGVCWSPKASDDGLAQIFITPTQSDSNEVQAVLVHELIHATIGNDKGHGSVFKQCALAVGLEGKMRATVPSPKLQERLNTFTKELGPIPHAKLNLNMGKPKQTTRLIKVVCSETEYSARLTRTWIDQYGPPLCACCGIPMREETK